jgi:hypothetical protein
MCLKQDSTICFSVAGAQTVAVAEVCEMLTRNDVLKHDYALNHKWTITRIIQSYESDEKLAYIHGFDAGIGLLCEKAKLSSPAIAEDVRKLANEMFEEAARTLRELRRDKEEVTIRFSMHRS